jgi:hypothetical protein
MPTIAYAGPVNCPREERASRPWPRATVRARHPLPGCRRPLASNTKSRRRYRRKQGRIEGTTACHPAVISTITYRQAPRPWPGRPGPRCRVPCPRTGHPRPLLYSALPCPALPCPALPCPVLSFSGPPPAGCRAGFGNRVTSVALLGLYLDLLRMATGGLWSRKRAERGGGKSRAR